MKVMIIEDDPGIVETVSLCFDLRWPEANIISAKQGIEGVDLVAKEHPDIVVLDIGLPDIDGFEVCRRIRMFSDVPIAILTAADLEIDKVKGLELGADDYITKPFSHVELLARIKAVLRRCTSGIPQEDEGTFATENLWIDFAAREVRIDGKEIRLTPTEYNLLYCLAKNVGKVVPHRVLLDRVWGPEYDNAVEYVKVYVQRLRVKIGDNTAAPKLIRCERGIGYKLDVSRKKPAQEAGLVTAGV